MSSEILKCHECISNSTMGDWNAEHLRAFWFCSIGIAPFSKSRNITNSYIICHYRTLAPQQGLQRYMWRDFEHLIGIYRAQKHAKAFN